LPIFFLINAHLTELTGGPHFQMSNTKLQVFADESKKRGFLLAAAVLEHGELSRLRSAVNELRLPGQRRLPSAVCTVPRKATDGESQ
jgi:hypothetical protein